MVVLSEASPALGNSASGRDIEASMRAAQIAGCSVYHLPPDFEDAEADAALWHVPAQTAPTSAVWLGFIPSPTRYAAVYEAARSKNLFLLNTPTQHLRAQEWDKTYPFLEGMTPRTVFITSEAECHAAAQAVGLPAFVKGAVQGRKAKGWKACVAETVPELQTLTRHLLDLSNRSRGRVAVRELIKLRHTRVSAQDFPLGREYRVFLYNAAVLGWGYYWEGNDPLRATTPDEENQILALAQNAARKLAVPYVAVDIGQKESGDWTIIETGDAQFSGVSQIPLLALWNHIGRIVYAPPEENKVSPPTTGDL